MPKFEDLGPGEIPTHWVYEGRGLKFEFPAYDYSERRAEPQQGAIVVAKYIIEGTIRWGMKQAKCRTLELQEYEMIKSDIRSAIGIANQFYGTHRPDFRIEFLNSHREIPRTIF
jgi:hypothetical protein